MNLDDLKQSVSSMDDAELTSLLRDIRATRRTPVSTPKKQTEKKAKAPAVTDLSLATLIAGMSKEQLTAALNKMNKEK